MAVFAFTPQTTVRLLKGVPLVSDYQDTLDFDSVSAQTTYFSSFIFKTYSDFTYQRQTQSIRVPAEFDTVVNTNYVMYRNNNYTNKWFYAFATDIRYINPGLTEIDIEIDVMQTWLFDYQFLECFIERETVADDTRFVHTIPEGLEFGPVKVAKDQLINFSDFDVVLAISPSTEGGSGGQLINGMFSGVEYYHQHATTQGVALINEYIAGLAAEGRLEDIVSVFMVPTRVILPYTNYWPGHFFESSIDGYVPKNKKLFTYPYFYLTCNNNAGQENMYRFELFSNPNAINWGMATLFNESASIFFYPMDYAGVTENWLEGVTLDGFPQCSWRGNTFADYLSRNKYQLTMQGVSDLFTVIGAIVTGDPSGLSGVFNSMAQLGDKSMYPYQIQGQAANNTINVSYNRVGFSVRTMSITAEYAKIIDDYFSHFGYKVNRMGIPDTKTRTSWNYLRTHNCRIVGDFPESHQHKIESIFNTGVTIWHGGPVGDYSRDNSIISPPPTPSYPDPSIPRTREALFNAAKNSPLEISAQ